MVHLIDKDALVVEIERRIKEHNFLADAAANNNLHNTLEANELLIRNYKSLISFLGTLEVKDVDLEKEATRFVQTKEFAECEESPVLCLAKHFFELGLKAKQG